MGKTCFVLCINGVVSPEAYTTLKDACSNLGVSYQMALRGKREFKKGLILTEVKIHKSIGKIREGKNLFKKRINDNSAN